MSVQIPPEPNAGMESTEKIEKIPPIKPGWARALLIIPVWLVLYFIMGIALIVVTGEIDTSKFDAMMSQPVGILVQFLQMLVFLIPIFIFRKFIDARSIKSLGYELNKKFVLDFLWGALSGIVLISIIFLIIYCGDGLAIVSIKAPTPSFLILTIVMFLVGISEESLVRGYLLANCMDSFNKYVALFVTSLLFTAMHLFNPNASALGTINIVLAGLLLGIYYIHRRNLWFPIALHWTWNLFQGSFYGSKVSGVAIDSVVTIKTTGSDLFTGGEFGFEASLVTTFVLIGVIVIFHMIFRPRPVPVESSLSA